MINSISRRRTFFVAFLWQKISQFFLANWTCFH